MSKQVITAGAVALTVLTGAGCGSSGSSAHSTVTVTVPASSARPVTSITPAGASAPDPLAIIRKIPGAAVVSGGGYDISGDRLGNGAIYQGTCTGSCAEQLTVYTNASQAALNSNLSTLLAGPGDNAIITGDRFIVEVTGVVELASNKTAYFVSPAQIARDVHGTLAYMPSGTG